MREWAPYLLLYLVGLAHWMAFLDFGNIAPGLFDWPSEYAGLSVLKSAVSSGSIPFYVSPPFVSTDRFMAMPLTMLFPHVVLLKWLSVRAFEAAQVAGFYTAGYAGAMAIKRRYGISWPGFTAFFLLFNFNGYLTSHLSVGHVVCWTGYFFLPWFFLLVMDWAKNGASVRVSLGISLVVFAESLTGSVHFFNWCLIFVLLLGLRKSGWLVPACLTAAVSVMLATYRLLPGLAVFGSLRHGSPTGYPSLYVMADGLLTLYPPGRPTVNAMGWWEYDMYVGAAGLAMLALFGALPLFLRAVRATDRAGFHRLDLPLAGMVLLSYGENYWWLLYGFPGLSVERVASRMLVLPLALLAVLTAVRLEELAGIFRRRPVLAAARTGVLLLAALQMARHSWVWRPSAMAGKAAGAWTPPPPPVIVDGPGGIYTASVAAGWAITLSVLGAVVYALWKTGKRGRMP